MKVNGQLKNALLEIVDKASYVAEKCGRIFFDKECKSIMIDNGDDCLRIQDNRDMPVGSILMWASDTNIPSHYISADGRLLNRTTYSELFDVLGTIYGDGDGVTTFNIPDYRGQFIRGLSGASSCDPDRGSRDDRGDGVTGNAVGTTQDHALQNHNHTYIDRYHTAEHPANITPTGDGVGKDLANTNWNTGNVDVGNSSAETRPKNIYVLFLIKVK